MPKLASSVHPHIPPACCLLLNDEMEFSPLLDESPQLSALLRILWASHPGNLLFLIFTHLPLLPRGRLCLGFPCLLPSPADTGLLHPSEPGLCLVRFQQGAEPTEAHRALGFNLSPARASLKTKSSPVTPEPSTPCSASAQTFPHHSQGMLPTPGEEHLVPAVAAPRAQREGHLCSRALAFPSLFIYFPCLLRSPRLRGHLHNRIRGSCTGTAHASPRAPSPSSQEHLSLPWSIHPFFLGAPIPSLEDPSAPQSTHPFFPGEPIPSLQHPFLHWSTHPFFPSILPSLEHSSLLPWNTQSFLGASTPPQSTHPFFPGAATPSAHSHSTKPHRSISTPMEQIHEVWCCSQGRAWT